MTIFEREFETWMKQNISQEKSPRRLELLEKVLGYSSVDFLKRVWFPAVGHFNDLYPEWEVRDFNNGYRYLDFAYMPGGAKGGIEIQGFGTHARDLDVRRFKDLCQRHCLLTLDDWKFLSIPYLSIRDEPKPCQQLILSFVGKFISQDVNEKLSWLEAETVRFLRRLLRPVTPKELAIHLRISNKHARRIFHQLLDMEIVQVVGNVQRYRSYVLVLS